MNKILAKSCTILAVFVTAAKAQDSATYQYDALGRVTSAQYSGAVTRTQSACYDPAGNRTAYKSSATGGTKNCAASPTPTSTPPPGNQPPVANPDTAPNIPKCGSTTVNVTANDTDPEGDLPLAVTGASSGAALVVTVLNGSTLFIESIGGSGAKTFTYTVRDSLGATATGSGTVMVTAVNACS